MPKLTQLEELAIAIRLAATDAESSVRSRAIAEAFVDSNEELVAPYKQEWAIEKVTTLVAKHRAKARRERDQQLVLEGTIGFSRLPRKLTNRSGQSFPRSQATTPYFRKLVADLRKQKSPLLEEAERALALIHSYSTVGGGRTTWGEVVEREAKKAGKKGK